MLFLIASQNEHNATEINEQECNHISGRCHEPVGGDVGIPESGARRDDGAAEVDGRFGVRRASL